MATAVSPLAQFFELCEQNPDARYELDEGEIIELGGVSMTHGLVTAQIIHLLKTLAADSDKKPFVANGPGFGLGSATFRIPDVIVISRAAYEALQQQRGWYAGAPELAIEVVSTHDTARQIDRKRRQYLEAGAASVWIVYPELRHVMVFRADGSVGDFVAGRSISEPALFGDRAVDVSAVFADLPSL